MQAYLNTLPVREKKYCNFDCLSPSCSNFTREITLKPDSVVTAFWELALYPISTEHIYKQNTRFWDVSLTGTNMQAYLNTLPVREEKYCNFDCLSPSCSNFTREITLKPDSVVTAFWELAPYPISAEHIYNLDTKFWAISLSGTNTLAYLNLFQVTEEKYV